MIDRPGPALLELIDRPALRLWAEIREGAGIDHVSCARKRTVVVFRPITPWSGQLFFSVLVLAFFFEGLCWRCSYAVSVWFLGFVAVTRRRENIHTCDE